MSNKHPLTMYMGEELGECRAENEQLRAEASHEEEFRIELLQEAQELRAENERLRARVLSAECFDDEHNECSGQFDLGDRVTGTCACACHRRR